MSYILRNPAGDIILFNNLKEHLLLNASMMGLHSFTLEETSEEIVQGEDTAEKKCYYIKGTEPSPGLEVLKKKKNSELNEACEKEILSGFWWQFPNQSLLHFSYDVYDQQNFSDTGNACNTAIITNNLEQKVIWNGYKELEHISLVTLTLTPFEFLPFYQQGALISHKASLMYKCTEKKKLVSEAKTKEEVEEITWQD